MFSAHIGKLNPDLRRMALFAGAALLVVSLTIASSSRVQAAPVSPVTQDADTEPVTPSVAAAQGQIAVRALSPQEAVASAQASGLVEIS